MTKISFPRIQDVAPNAIVSCLETLASANYTLVPFGITKNPRRMAHFLAQILHESGGFTQVVENLNYSGNRLTVVFPSRFPSLASTRPYAKNPTALANFVYGSRLGNTEVGDGWKFRGRGLIQLTGKSNYQRIGSAFDVDLVTSPDDILKPELLLITAAEFWRQAKCNQLADRDDIMAVTKAINGGLNGLVDRRAWLEKTQTILYEE